MPSPAVLSALAAAALFGASTPMAKALVGEIPPLLLAGILYLGSGIGLVAARLTRDRAWRASGMTPSEWPFYAGAIAFGGVLGPALLMFGLTRTSASAASLLLNLEGVLSALLAWVVFRENADRRLVLGMLAIVAGGVVLSWDGALAAEEGWLGPAAIALACLCWAIDNNFTRKVSASDSLYIAGVKGGVAGVINVSIAVAFGATLPPAPQLAAALAVGLAGYGVSLVLFVHGLRGLGAARTGAYFSIAPFIGAAVAVILFGEETSTGFWIASLLMGIGVWLHLTERHEHAHAHEPLEHGHPHVHDDHHQHQHPAGWDGTEPHDHRHGHARLAHTHAHYPDIHHHHPHP